MAAGKPDVPKASVKGLTMNKVVWISLMSWAMALPPAAREPLAELAVAPGKVTVEPAAWNKPAVIRTPEEAAKAFDKEALAIVTRKVDFASQVVLVFAWRGSGGDKLEHAVAESFPEQVRFSLARGRTKDLRAHGKVFVVNSNARWSAEERK